MAAWLARWLRVIGVAALIGSPGHGSANRLRQSPASSVMTARPAQAGRLAGRSRPSVRPRGRSLMTVVRWMPNCSDSSGDRGSGRLDRRQFDRLVRGQIGMGLPVGWRHPRRLTEPRQQLRHA